MIIDDFESLFPLTDYQREFMALMTDNVGKLNIHCGRAYGRTYVHHILKRIVIVHLLSTLEKVKWTKAGSIVVTTIVSKDELLKFYPLALE